MVLVSVPIATYNRARYLAECVDSVLSQTYQTLEIVVVDDASTDETPAVAARYGDRIRYVRHEQNRGFIETFKHASSLCTGKYETYFGDDDVPMPTYIERGVEVMENDERIAKFYTDCYLIDRQSRRIGTETYLHAHRRRIGKVTQDDLFLKGCVVHLGMNRRSVYEVIGGYDSTFNGCADLDLYLRMTGAGYDIVYLDEPLMHYRIHPSMASHRESEMWKHTILALEHNLQRFPDAYQRLRGQMDKRLGMQKAWLAVRLFWERQFRQSLKYGVSATCQYLPAVPIGAAQMAVSKLTGRRSVYHLDD